MHVKLPFQHMYGTHLLESTYITYLEPIFSMQWWCLTVSGQTLVRGEEMLNLLVKGEQRSHNKRKVYEVDGAPWPLFCLPCSDSGEILAISKD